LIETTSKVGDADGVCAEGFAGICASSVTEETAMPTSRMDTHRTGGRPFHEK
jgi:hypothetical protein